MLSKQRRLKVGMYVCMTEKRKKKEGKKSKLNITLLIVLFKINKRNGGLLNKLLIDIIDKYCV